MLPTGTGKTFVGATIALKQLELNQIEKVLIVVPTTVLLEQWKEEIIKFYGDSLLHKIQIVCIQTAYKNTYETDLLILDEIHTTLSPEYKKIYINVKTKQILGLTATIPEDEDYKKTLAEECPVIYIKTVNEIVSKVVSNYQIYNLEVKLNRKDGAKYRTFDNEFKRAQMELGIIKSRDETLKDKLIFDIAKENCTKKEKSPIVMYSKKFWSSMTMRKWVCYEAESKIDYVVDIIKKFPNRKWIIFNKSIKFAETLKSHIDNSVVYHSKMKEDERKIVLKNFENGTFSILIAVDALNAGLNVPDVDSAICVSGVSTELTNVQQLGRIIRFRDNKLALFINLYSSNTVEENWVKSKTKNLNNVTWVKSVQSCLDLHKKLTETNYKST